MNRKLVYDNGDNLSPNLFDIFINDLPNIFHETDDQVELDNFKISSLLYADNLIILSTSKSGLQSGLNKLASYCGNNCLTVNLKKTKIVVFSKSGKVSTDKFYFNDVQMDRVKRIWYLLLLMRAAKVQASLRIRAVSPEPSLLAHTSSESRGTFRQKARSLAPLNGWACAVKICHYECSKTQIRLTGLK